MEHKEDKVELEQLQKPCEFAGTDACDHCLLACPNQIALIERRLS